MSPRASVARQNRGLGNGQSDGPAVPLPPEESLDPED
jgi:hypothetical protein